MILFCKNTKQNLKKSVNFREKIPDNKNVTDLSSDNQFSLFLKHQFTSNIFLKQSTNTHKINNNKNKNFRTSRASLGRRGSKTADVLTNATSVCACAF